jgi:5-methylcytosine-specific restriction enzyme subunit McrC
MTQSQTRNVTIREYGLLLKGGDRDAIDCCSIPARAFDWLLTNGQSGNESQRELVKVKRYGKAIALQVVNFVGVLDTPCGTRIEILPKIIESSAGAMDSKKVLLKMLSTVHKLTLEKFNQSKLQTLNQPLIEILITQFLIEVSSVVKRGIRSEYQRVEKQSKYLKGQLQTAKQLRQRPGCQSRFHISHDLFTPNRPENRLIHSSLIQVMKWTKSTVNQRLSREILFIFNEIDLSCNIKNDFRKWSTDRSLAHYKSVKSWCELILSYQSPIAMSGNNNGISFLFPMEVLFERYVAKMLAKQLPKGLSLSEQISNQTLTAHKDENWFRLKPDIVIKDKNHTLCVADTKWKVLDERKGTAKHKYDLKQSDIYQLFAYGEKYLEGEGDLYLIYPKHTFFNERLDLFEYKEGLRLHVVPYDLENDICDIPLDLGESVTLG